jgi:hypothetical protein
MPVAFRSGPTSDTYRDEVMFDHPVGYWQLREGQCGQTVIDETTRRPGSFVLCPDNVHLGKPGLVAGHDRSTGFNNPQNNLSAFGHVLIPSGGVIPYTEYTFEAWFRTTQVAGVTFVTLVCQGDPDDEDTAGMFLGRTGSTIKPISFDHQGDFSFYTASPNLADGLRHHFVYMKRNGLLIAYVDRVNLGQVTALDNSPYASSKSLFIGSDELDVEPLVGDESDVAFYDYGLPEDRVFRHFDVGAAT